MAANGSEQYSVFVHSPTPGGNNSAVPGVAWSAVLVNSGMNVTSLPIGSGGGRISQNEANAIAAGSVFETSFTWTDPRPDGGAGANAERAADLDARATQAVALALANFQRQMKYFGHEVA
jgi:hypothetical protein